MNFPTSPKSFSDVDLPFLPSEELCILKSKVDDSLQFYRPEGSYTTRRAAKRWSRWRMVPCPLGIHLRSDGGAKSPAMWVGQEDRFAISMLSTKLELPPIEIA